MRLTRTCASALGRRLAALAVVMTFAGSALSATHDTASRRPEGGQAPVAISADLSGDAARTRLVITLSKAVAAQALLIERPDRVIIDLPEVNFQLPAGAGGRREGLVASFRCGLFAPGRSRVVIDLAQTATVSRLDVTKAPGDGATLLTIELSRADRETFRRAAAESRASAPQPPAAPAISEAQNDRRPVIVLDPGHGGIDPGALAAGGTLEKDIVFSFAQRLKSRLEAGGRYRVLLTRNEDVFIPLRDRVQMARSAKADLFVSIHADTISAAPQVRGLTVYTGAERASDAESAKVAERENKADAVAGIDAEDRPDEVSDILQELMMRETRGFSHRFAAKLIGELKPMIQLNSRPHREARFLVLRAPDVPAVLVELGYLSSQKDISLLMSQDWRDRSADAMATAIDRFFATRLATQGTAAVSP